MRPPHGEVVTHIPPQTYGDHPEPSEPTSRPQIRRQIERICESLGVEFESVSQLNLEFNVATVTYHLRNSEGNFYLNEFGKPAIGIRRIPIDTATFLGDERDF